MRKISTILKTAMFASVVLLAGKSFAAVDPYELEGQWKFSATFELVDNEYAEDLLNDNVVTITAVSTSAMNFENFVWAGSTRRVLNSYSHYVTGTGMVNGAVNEFSAVTINADGQNSGTYVVCFADAQGTNPTISRTRDGYDLVFTDNADGTITVPNFTIVEITGEGDSDTSIIARYSNVVMTFISEETGDTHNFQGLYTVSGTKTTFVDGGIVDSSSEAASFQMEIWNGDTRFVFQQFAGFDDITGVRNGMAGSAKENELSFGYGYPFLESYTGDTLAESYYFTLGGGEIETQGGVPENKGDKYIVLTYNEADGSYSLDDFTVWKRMYNESETGGTLLERWSNLTVTQTMDADGVDSISKDEVDAPAVYFNLQGVQVANPSNGIFIKKQGDKATKVVIK